MIDRFEDLPGIISELQDGGLQIFEENGSPAVLVLGTAESGLSDVPVQVTRAQEEENRFKKSGTLIRGMYETLQGGAGNVNLMRIGARSAILFGVGTDNMVTNPTSIETLLKDADAGKAYLIRYVTPATRGPNELVGHLKVKNAAGALVYDGNPGGQLIDTGEVLVSGAFTGGADIGAAGDPDDFVALEDVAVDKVQVTGEAVGAIPGVPTAADQFDLSESLTNAGTYVVYVDGDEIAESLFTINAGAGTAGVDQLEIDSVTAGYTGAEAVTIDFTYDDDAAHNLREGADGTNLSLMELYEALEGAYRSLETEEYKMVIPMGTAVDSKNTEDGDIVVLSSDERIAAGRRYPVPGSAGDALAKLFIEEYDGEFFYFWDTNDDGVAEVYPSVGSATSATKIDGSALTAEDFTEVNFPYQLAAFCFKTSSNEYNVLGAIGTSTPASFSAKDVSKWIGKEPTYDVDGNIVVNGTGLLGNKLMVGLANHEPGFYGTDLEEYQGSSGAVGGGVLEDRGGRPIDIGRYLSVYSAPQTFFNPVDETGFGYHANGAAYYGGYITTLATKSSPSNKIAPDAVSPVKLSKAKLNSLAKYSYVGLKQKNRVLRFSDAPTAARKTSDFKRLTTMRVIDETIDDIRLVAAPYIGEPNTVSARQSLESNLITLLGEKQEDGVIQRFEIKVSATTKQRIEGDMTVELVIVPPFEVKKIEVVTSLAKE